MCATSLDSKVDLPVLCVGNENDSHYASQRYGAACAAMSGGINVSAVNKKRTYLIKVQAMAHRVQGGVQ